MRATRRVFVALPVAAHTATAIHERVSELSGESPSFRWVHPDLYHVTLCFLGELDPDRIRLLQTRLARVALPVFDISFSGIGLFPISGRDVRVVHTPVAEGIAPCRELFAAVAAACRSIDDAFRFDFRPHLTLARVRRRDSSAAYELRRRVTAVSFEVAMQCSEFALYESVLGHGGPRYIALRSYLLESP